jgi:hypothetical protein
VWVSKYTTASVERATHCEKTHAVPPLEVADELLQLLHAHLGVDHNAVCIHGGQHGKARHGGAHHGGLADALVGAFASALQQAPLPFLVRRKRARARPRIHDRLRAVGAASLVFFLYDVLRDHVPELLPPLAIGTVHQRRAPRSQRRHEGSHPPLGFLCSLVLPLHGRGVAEVLHEANPEARGDGRGAPRLRGGLS